MKRIGNYYSNKGIHIEFLLIVHFAHSINVLMHFTRMKEEIQQALQKASVEALRYQAKIALLQSKKREYDFFLQVLSNKRAKIETSEPEKKYLNSLTIISSHVNIHVYLPFRSRN